MSSRTILTSLLFGAVALSAVAGCRGQTSKDSPVVGIRNMYDQPKFDIQEEQEDHLFEDGRTMRPIVADTVSREREVDIRFAEGRTEDNTAWVLTVPEAMVKRNGGWDKMVQRGQDRYNVFCTPCHDKTGSGHGLVQKRAVASGATAFAPPTFHQDRLRHIPDGQLFATISNGKNNMPPYGWQMPVEDRWAIVSYVRALQLSQAKTESNL
jgi:mono/diheme cytochrome c family protein